MDEYDAGHIPGASPSPTKALQAAQKLFDMGDTNIYEFGGIIDWTGEVVTGSEKRCCFPAADQANRESLGLPAGRSG